MAMEKYSSSRRIVHDYKETHKLAEVHIIQSMENHKILENSELYKLYDTQYQQTNKSAFLKKIMRKLKL